MLGGDVLTSATVQAVGESTGLQAWAKPGIARAVTMDEKKSLMRVLLEVYVSLG